MAAGAIVKSKDPVLESECILFSDCPELAKAIIDRIVRGAAGYTTDADPRLLPPLPVEMLSAALAVAPHETTPVRQRIYYDTQGCALKKAGIEVRMEYNPKNRLWCQTVKYEVDEGKCEAPEDDAVLVHHRMEQKASLNRPGFCLEAVQPRELHERIQATIGKSPVLPVLSLISQRTRLCYHPEGDRDIAIEIAVEPLHVGTTLSGVSWSDAKIELEIKKGPEEGPARDALLRREVERLQTLARQIRSEASLRVSSRSSAAGGLEEVAGFLNTSDGRRAFTSQIPDAWPDVSQWLARRNPDGPESAPTPPAVS